MGQRPRPPYKSITNTGGSEETVGGVRRVAMETAQATNQAQSVESPQIDAAPLNVVRLTPPVQTTRRILLNSVPYLIGPAVVRPPPRRHPRESEVGRRPWLLRLRLLPPRLP